MKPGDILPLLLLFFGTSVKVGAGLGLSSMLFRSSVSYKQVT